MSHATPRVEGADHEGGPQGVFGTKILAGLLALLLIAGVGVTSFFAVSSSWQEPLKLGRESRSRAPRAPGPLPVIVPQLAAPPPSEVEGPPPVARMLDAQSRAAAAAKQRVETHSAIPAVRDRGSPRTLEFRPPLRVTLARRAVAQPQRILYASGVVQLGEYSNRRQADAAYARLIRVYPYIKTLPKTITAWRTPNGSGRDYQLRVRAYSPDHARILCQNLLAIGRGCAVMPDLRAQNIL